LKLPTFLIAGAQKSGTTSMHLFLRAHSAVFIPQRPQELHFFDLDANYRRGLGWYAAHFVAAGPAHAALGQTSPLYIYSPQAPARIAAALPNVKLIFILRNPLTRAYSHYWHEFKKGYEPLPFPLAIEREPERLAQGPAARRHFSYVDRGRYAGQLARYRHYFSREQMLILLNENLRQDPVSTIDVCCSFLEIERQGAQIVARLGQSQFNQFRVPRSVSVQRLLAPYRWKLPRLIKLVDMLNFKTAAYPPMDAHSRQILSVLFAEENQRLAEMFNLDLTCWQDARAAEEANGAKNG